MAVYNREDSRTVLPQLEKQIEELSYALQSNAQAIKEVANTVPRFDYGLKVLLTTVAANSYSDFSVTFAAPFTKIPVVVAGLWSSSTGSGVGHISVSAFDITKTGFTIRVFNGDTSPRQPSISWIAISKETT